jgi:hypothetical protein
VPLVEPLVLAVPAVEPPRSPVPAVVVPPVLAVPVVVLPAPAESVLMLVSPVPLLPPVVVPEASVEVPSLPLPLPPQEASRVVLSAKAAKARGSFMVRMGWTNKGKNVLLIRGFHRRHWRDYCGFIPQMPREKYGILPAVSVNIHSAKLPVVLSVRRW